MTDAILSKDSNLNFPHSTLLKASAGSGKTHSLTARFVQFLLSDKIPHNHLRNILAITFSNNAAKEMKGRILSWLKEIHFRNTDKLHQISQTLSLDEDQLVRRSEALINEILANYSDFQVKTIDSFMTSVYKASAIDLGFSPDFDIILTPDAVMAYAFNRFLRRVKTGTSEASFLDQLLERIAENRGSDASYLWNPSGSLLDEIKELHHKLSGIAKPVTIPAEEDGSVSISKEIAQTAQALHSIINQSGLKRSERSTFERILEIARTKKFPDLIGIGLKSPPVLKPKDAERHITYQQISERWKILGDLIRHYTRIYAVRYQMPYLKIYNIFSDTLQQTKREEEIVFIDDINKDLFRHLEQEIIPDVYFKIGETVFHYLIDEFQDTSPIQWKNLYRLIENSIAQGGSFFAVGDTKQAIYGFRNADYRIMRLMESTSPFPSAPHTVSELSINYRSLKHIVHFNKEFFQNIVPAHNKYREAAGRSGLSDYMQHVKKERRSPGCVDVKVYEKNDEAPAEKKALQDCVESLKARGYNYSDIAILTQRNEDVVNITAWLNEIDIPFISYSSLDIRRRKLTGEIFFLLNFLDSPQDNLSFAGFLLGDVFRKSMEHNGKTVEPQTLHGFLFSNRKKTPLYKLFQDAFPSLWKDCFDGLFRSTGYLPLYDLVSEIYRVFGVFHIFREEEATLIKILEIIKNLEREGMNNPGDFLRLAADETPADTQWNIAVPDGIEAVKVMTIHKAKGLGFPAVVVVLYGEQQQGIKYILDEREAGTRLLKITRAIADTDETLERIYEEERMKETVNKLNMLYVGFTRPESELYVIGISGGKKQFPIDLLEDACGTRGEKAAAMTSPAIHQTIVPLYHAAHPADLSSFRSIEEFNIEERRRGEFIHRVLSHIEYLDEELDSQLQKLIDETKKETNFDVPAESIKKELRSFLLKPEVKSYFTPKPARVIGREQDFTDEKGNLLRMDRVVIDEDRVTVMDYKTGGDKKAEEAHVLQLKNYMRILHDIYPDKKIEGTIAYIDLKEVVRINEGISDFSRP